MLLGAEATKLVAVPGGFIATGLVGYQADLWISRDGTTWLPVMGFDVADAIDMELSSDGRRALLVTVTPPGVATFVTSRVTGP